MLEFVHHCGAQAAQRWLRLWRSFFSLRGLVNVNPGLIKPLGCLIGVIPFKYHIMTIWRVPPQLINHGLLIRSWHYMEIVPRGKASKLAPLLIH